MHLPSNKWLHIFCTPLGARNAIRFALNHMHFQGNCQLFPCILFYFYWNWLCPFDWVTLPSIVAPAETPFLHPQNTVTATKSAFSKHAEFRYVILKGFSQLWWRCESPRVLVSIFICIKANLFPGHIVLKLCMHIDHSFNWDSG